jgi:hypothetical protein
MGNVVVRGCGRDVTRCGCDASVIINVVICEGNIVWVACTPEKREMIEVHVLPHADAKSDELLSVRVPSLAVYTVGALAGRVRAALQSAGATEERTVLCAKKLWDPALLWEPLLHNGATLEEAGIDDVTVVTLASPEEAEEFGHTTPLMPMTTTTTTACPDDSPAPPAPPSALPRPATASMSLSAAMAVHEAGIGVICQRPQTTTGELLRFRTPMPVSRLGTTDWSQRPPSRLVAQPPPKGRSADQLNLAPEPTPVTAASSGGDIDRIQAEMQRFFEEQSRATSATMTTAAAPSDGDDVYMQYPSDGELEVEEIE